MYLILSTKIEMDCHRCGIVVTIAFAVLIGSARVCEGVNDPDIPVFKRNYSVLSFIDVNTYKVIDCSAENYLDIAWFKDGVPFPFGWNERQLLDMGVSLDSNNQSLVLTKAEMMTEGNYSCMVSNQHGAIERELELRVEGNEWIHGPILAFDNHCSGRSTTIGSNVTLSCKFFVGPNGDETVASWYYVERATPEEKESHHQKNALVWIYMRELNYTEYDTPAPWMDGKLLDVSLHILNVTQPALGTYVVMVSNGVEPAAQHRITLSLPNRNRNVGGSRLGQILSRTQGNAGL